MRNKFLNNKEIESISKGSVLYRPGEVPALTKEQIAQANLVSKLPNDFPFANWEDMTTKQQLRTMQYSGLNAQDQWSLLNANIPLAVLNEHNQVQDKNETREYATKIVTTLMNTAAQAAAAKAQAAVGKPTVSTPLQSNGLRQKLNLLKEEYEKPPLGKAAGSTGGAVATPSPTPLPQPGATPVQTPNPYQDVDSTIFREPPPRPYPPEVIPTIETYDWYSSYDEAADAWAKENVGLSKDLERCAMIYKNIDINEKERYTFTESYYGMDEIPFLGIRPNVVIPFVWLRYLDSGIPESDMVGFIHSHPGPPENMSYASASDEDLSLNKYGIEYVTIVPYETGEPDTRRLTDID